jgi:hypothetical protein
MCKSNKQINSYVSKVNSEQMREITSYEFEHFEDICKKIKIKLKEEQNKISCFEVYNKI